MAGTTPNRTIAANKKAFHDYFVEEALEAGIELSARRSNPCGRGCQPQGCLVRDRRGNVGARHARQPL